MSADERASAAAYLGNFREAIAALFGDSDVDPARHPTYFVDRINAWLEHGALGGTLDGDRRLRDLVLEVYRRARLDVPSTVLRLCAAPESSVGAAVFPVAVMNGREHTGALRIIEVGGSTHASRHPVVDQAFSRAVEAARRVALTLCAGDVKSRVRQAKWRILPDLPSNAALADGSVALAAFVAFISLALDRPIPTTRAFSGVLDRQRFVSPSRATSADKLVALGERPAITSLHWPGGALLGDQRVDDEARPERLLARVFEEPWEELSERLLGGAARSESSGRRLRAIVVGGALVLAVGAAGLVGTRWVSSGWLAPAPAVTPSAPLPPPMQLPGPFSDLRIGAAVAELNTLFPPTEDTISCVPRLVGDNQVPRIVSPALAQTARSSCARVEQMAGLSKAERLKMAEAAKTLGTADGPAALDAMILAMAQVRGSVRAGTIDEAALIDATREQATSAHELVPITASQLMTGMAAFVRPRQARREIAAVLAEDCSGSDPERARTYVFGGCSLGQIDGAARARVSYGKCRNAYLQNEHRLQLRFLRSTGALGAIGLARAARPDRALDPSNATSFVAYTTRAHLDLSTAKLGVQIANGIKEAESYWAGAIALTPGVDEGPWQDAVVWIRDGRVARVLVNIRDDKQLGDLAAALDKAFASKGMTKDAITTWGLPGGIVARLDLGAALCLVVERSSANPEPHPTGATTAEERAPTP